MPLRKKALEFSRDVLYNNRGICRCDGIGRRSGFKIRRWRHRVGSSPTTGTKSERNPLHSVLRRSLFRAALKLCSAPLLLLSNSNLLRWASSWFWWHDDHLNEVRSIEQFLDCTMLLTLFLPQSLARSDFFYVSWWMPKMSSLWQNLWNLWLKWGNHHFWTPCPNQRGVLEQVALLTRTQLGTSTWNCIWRIYCLLFSCSFLW